MFLLASTPPLFPSSIGVCCDSFFFYMCRLCPVFPPYAERNQPRSDNLFPYFSETCPMPPLKSTRNTGQNVYSWQCVRSYLRRRLVGKRRKRQKKVQLGEEPRLNPLQNIANYTTTSRDCNARPEVRPRNVSSRAVPTSMCELYRYSNFAVSKRGLLTRSRGVTNTALAKLARLLPFLLHVLSVRFRKLIGETSPWTLGAARPR